MDPINIVVADAQKTQGRLADLCPNEIEFFKQRFVWSSSTEGFYTRRAYEPIKVGGFTIPKWSPYKTRGRWQKLYPELVDSLVEKHLDFERFCGICNPRDRLAPRDAETAFWFGTMAGRWTYTSCIDLDNHDTIGWIAAPSRWHQSKTGYLDGPYSYRYLPVPEPNLRFFQVAKVVHDLFPRTIWAFSSASLGLAVWNISNARQATGVIYRRTNNLLGRVGLDWLECYPQPSGAGDSFGRCHRRPCGMDSAVISQAKLITDPIEQIRAFMRPPATPDFARIATAILGQMEVAHEQFLACGEGHDHERLSLEERLDRVNSCRAVIKLVHGWLTDGCPIDRDLLYQSDQDNVREVEEAVTESEAVELSTCCPDSNEAHPEFFWEVDLKAITKAGQWVQFVQFLVENGFPCEDKFSEVVSTLTLWFGFVELHGHDRDRIRQVVRAFVLIGHNGKITRFNQGKTTEVLSHVDRIVDSVLDNEDQAGQGKFEDLRRRRKTGCYLDNYNFEPKILNKAAEVLPNTTTREQLSYLICGVLKPPDNEDCWSYEPDLTPLPDEVISRTRQAFQQAKRQLRRNKQTGRYPTLDAITCLFNYLLAGRKPGCRRASQLLLVQMGFPSKNGARTKIIDILVKAGLLHRGPYRSKSQSRQWRLDESVVEVMVWNQHIQSLK